MFAIPDATGANLTRRQAIALLGAMSASALLPTSAAYGSELTDLLAEANGIKDDITSTQDAYYKAVAELEQVNKDIADAENELDGYRDDLSRVVSSEYTGAGSVASIISGDATIDSLVAASAYYGKMQDDCSASIDDVEQTQARLEESKASLDQRTADMQDALDALEDKLDELRPRIASMTAELAEETASSSSKSQQAQATLEFLSNVDDVTDLQVRIVKAAYARGYAGAMYCERWVRLVLQDAGITHEGYVSAYYDYANECISSDKSTIPAGALLFGSGSSAQYSHVGIALTSSHTDDGSDVLVLDNEGSRKVAKTLPKWLEYQTAVSVHNGKSGWFGWGGNYLR